MQRFVRHAMALLALVAIYQETLALADGHDELSDGGRSANAASESNVAESAQPAGICCRLPSCDSRERRGACDPYGSCGCNADPPYGMVAFAGVDAFKGISDGSLTSNAGSVFGLNAGTPILQDFGLGWQAGVSFGAYDIDGHPFELEETQQQIFLTMGVFRKARQDQRVSFGIVYDWMSNNNWGVYANNPTLGQWRGQIEYALSNDNAVGLWGCVRDRNVAQLLDNGIVVQDQAANQANLFWRHKFVDLGADSWLWFGIPDHGRLDTTQGGSFSDWTVGISLQAPLSDRLALYTNGSYMHPSAAAGWDARIECGWDVGVGVVWYCGGSAVRHSINGGRWLPYMPLANNTNFLVEQNPTNLPLKR